MIIKRKKNDTKENINDKPFESIEPKEDFAIPEPEEEEEATE